MNLEKNHMKDKVIIITGGSSGIGRACALAFGRAGGKIVINGRNAQKLNEVGQELSAAGIEYLAVPGDVSQEQDCRQLIEQTITKYGRIDVMLNNAGISMRALFQDVDLDVIRQLMDINFWGTVYCTKFALPYLLQSKGSVIGVSSIAGYQGLPGRTGYSASKFAMQGFLGALRTETLHQGLHVMVACPGFTASNIRNTALAADGSQQGESPRDEAKMMTAEEVADHILKATRQRKRDLVLTTQGKLAVLLGKFLPGLTDKLVYNQMKKEPNSPFN